MPQSSAPGDPIWEVALLFPPQGSWSEDEYLGLATNRLVEFSDGNVEVLPVPTEDHQSIVALLFQIVHAFVAPRQLGKVLFAPLRVKLWEGRIREPDLVLMRAELADRRGQRFWTGADLVMEVVSDDDPQRDLEVKRDEYAQAGIPEYWIVDPRDSTIKVLSLSEQGKPYQVAGEYGRDESAASVLLPRLTVTVNDLFSQ